MMTRRNLGKAVAAMTFRGTGGVAPRRPDQQRSWIPPGVSPGSSAGVFRGRLVIIIGGGPPGSGLYVYDSSGNLIGSVAATTGTGPLGGQVEPVIAAYQYIGSSLIGWVQLLNGQLQGQDTGDSLPGALAFGGGEAILESGKKLPGEAMAVLDLLASAESLVTGPTSTTGLPMVSTFQGFGLGVGPGTIFIPPSGDTTGATDPDWIASALTLYSDVRLLPGSWHFAKGVNVAAGQSVTGPLGAVLNDVAGFSGTAIFYPGGNNVTLNGFSATLNYVSLVDFQNVNCKNYTMRDVVCTSGSPSGVTTPPDQVTNFNLHQSEFQNCQFIQNYGASSCWSLGTSGSGFSTSSVIDCKFSVGCPQGSAATANNRTVPGVNFPVPGNKNFDDVHYIGCQGYNLINSTGGAVNIDNAQPIFYHACTAASAAHDEDRIYFKDCSFDRAFGGCIETLSFTGISIEDCSVGNVTPLACTFGTKSIRQLGAGTTTNQGFVVVGTFGGIGTGQSSRQVKISNWQREGGGDLVIGTSPPSDIYLYSDVNDVIIDGPNVPDTGAAIQIDCQGCANVHIRAPHSNVSIVNPPQGGSLLLGNALTIYGASGSVNYGINGGAPQIGYNSGLQQNASGSFTSATDTATVTGIAVVSIGHRSIPANDVVTGARYHVYASGTYTTGAAAPTGATFGVYWGGITGTLIGAISPAAVAASAAGLGWSVEADVVWISAATVKVKLTLWWTTAAAAPISWVYSSQAGLSNATAENLTIAFNWASAPGSQSLAVDTCLVSRVA